ncbi:mesenteric estrogen-dependent adipogenesis protein [Polymixia lowei]
MIVTELEQFVRTPPPGFAVEVCSAGYCVKSDPENCLVLIDDFESCGGKVVFQSSLGRKVKMHNLWEYTRVRKSLLSKRIYLVMALCEENPPLTNKQTAKVPQGSRRYVVSIDGRDPFISWQIERGLNWTISSVAGESYRVDIDLSEALQTWTERHFHVLPGKDITAHVWRDTCFSLKYYSDALFDFPHWFGFSKRKFKLAVGPTQSTRKQDKGMNTCLSKKPLRRSS